MTIVKNQIQPKCIIECLAPNFFGEPMLVVKGTAENDETLVCIFARNNYVPIPRFGDD